MTILKKPHGSEGRRKSAIASDCPDRCLAQAGRKIANNRRLSPVRKSLLILRYRLVRKRCSTAREIAAAKKQPRSIRTGD
ncbi:MAG: hypothetical protein AAFN16_17450, partial [Pseudomonadota bacterium]